MDKLYARFVKPGGLSFDIGSRVGDRIGSFRRGGACVVALEPQPDCARMIRAVYEGDGGVTLVEAACGPEPGRLTLHINSANPTVTTASKDFVQAAEPRRLEPLRPPPCPNLLNYIPIRLGFVRRQDRPTAKEITMTAVTIGWRSISAAAAVMAAAMFPHAALAQGAYPARPVTLIVPAPPGGGTDIFARLLAELVETGLKQKVVVENKPGAGGTLGVTQITQAAPDGHTLGFVWNSPLTSSPHTLAVSYTPDSYRPIVSIGYSSYVLCAQPAFAATNAKELIERMREAGGKLTYGNDGVGGTMQLAAERVFRKLSVKVRAIPFGGAGETAKNFLGGHVDIYGGSIPPIVAHAAAGKAKCLLLTSAKPNSALPQAQGLEALGLAGEETVLWWGLIGPARLPDAVANTLQQQFAAAAETDRFKAAVEKQGGVVRVLAGRETDKLIRSELAALEEVAQAVGLQKKKN